MPGRLVKVTMAQSRSGMDWVVSPIYPPATERTGFKAPFRLINPSLLCSRLCSGRINIRYLWRIQSLGKKAVPRLRDSRPRLKPGSRNLGTLFLRCTVCLHVGWSCPRQASGRGILFQCLIPEIFARLLVRSGCMLSDQFLCSGYIVTTVDRVSPKDDCSFDQPSHFAIFKGSLLICVDLFRRNS